MSRRARARQLRSCVRDVSGDAKYQRHGRMLMRSGATKRRHRGVLGMSRRARAWQLRSCVRDVSGDAKYQRHGRMLMRSGATIRRHRGVTMF